MESALLSERSNSPEGGRSGSLNANHVNCLLPDHVHGADDEESWDAGEDGRVHDAQAADAVHFEVAGQHAAVLLATDAAGTGRVMAPRVLLDELGKRVLGYVVAWQRLAGDESGRFELRGELAREHDARHHA